MYVEKNALLKFNILKTISIPAIGHCMKPMMFHKLSRLTVVDIKTWFKSIALESLLNFQRFQDLSDITEAQEWAVYASTSKKKKKLES